MSAPAAAERPLEARTAPALAGPLATSVLSGVAGYVDTVGFIGLSGLFTAHVTGNLVTVGSALAWQHGAGAAARLCMLPVFMVAVGLTILLVGRLRARGRSSGAILTALLAAEALALGLFLLVALRLAPALRGAPDGWPILVVGAVGVLAMGIQNALMREVISSSAPTTMMTGNVTQFTIDLVRWLFPVEARGPARDAVRSQARQRLARTGGILLGFIAGAALGALAMHYVGFVCLAAPALIVAALALAASRGSDRRAPPQ
ncbi:MAG: YoaK family protein [Polyangia bacterium]